MLHRACGDKLRYAGRNTPMTRHVQDVSQHAQCGSQVVL